MKTLTPRAIVLCGLVLMALSIGTMTLADEPVCHSMPSELVDLAQDNGFEEYIDFYTIFYGPPFVYGYDKNLVASNSVVFWAKKTGDSIPESASYYLVLAKTDSSFWPSLERTIQWYPPGGLYLLREESVNLADFKYVDSLEVSGPDTVLTNYNGFFREYDGSDDTFVEYRGEWLVRIRYDW